jgi:hypothetical protein
MNPFCLLVELIADQNMEVGDLAVVEHVTVGRSVETVLIVEDMLLEVVDLIFVPLCRNGSGGLPVGNCLQEPIGDASE